MAVRRNARGNINGNMDFYKYFCIDVFLFSREERLTNCSFDGVYPISCETKLINLRPSSDVELFMCQT